MNFALAKWLKSPFLWRTPIAQWSLHLLQTACGTRSTTLIIGWNWRGRGGVCPLVYFRDLRLSVERGRTERDHVTSCPEMAQEPGPQRRPVLYGGWVRLIHWPRKPVCQLDVRPYRGHVRRITCVIGSLVIVIRRKKKGLLYKKKRNGRSWEAGHVNLHGMHCVSAMFLRCLFVFY